MSRFVCLFACAWLLLGSSQAGAQDKWEDQFDTYALGGLTGQSDWEQWDGSFNVDTRVVNSEFLTPGQSIEITGQPSYSVNGNDVVYDFANLPGGQPTSGNWILSARTYVPSSSNGVGWFIMLNEYPVTKNWSLQVQFDADQGIVHATEPAGLGDLPLIYDEWVSLVACIDIDDDRVDVFYGTDLLIEDGEWIVDGSAQIACLDLYGGEPATPGILGMFYDNVRMEGTRGGCLDLVTSPSPATSGGQLNLDIEGPTVKGGNAVVLVTSVDSNPVSIFLPVILPLDNNGEVSLGPVSIPGGLAGLQIGLKAYAVLGSGNPNESNTELVVLQ